ncbi:MAG: glutamyl-tRNA reductase [Candidatus Omnitrophica bacterium]|nr:glutamyl-tRNA reductase [Candidatus Omnitrophota bacterium]MCM8800320.1 glutamyl-tRNA reductase [Candidatus Omnitrophota bacterium]
MSLFILGISHKTSPLAVREKYSFPKKKISETLIKFSQNRILNGIVILSTCNRTEIYVTTDFIDEARVFLLNELGIKNNELGYFYFFLERDVVGHLFRVASGLDSQIIGETQILGQVKSAWQQARILEVIDRLLDTVFERAIETCLKVRRGTEISKGKISIGSVVMELIKTKFNFLSDKRILIIGVGKISELVLRYLKKERTDTVFVANRTYEKALRLAEHIDGEAVRFDRLREKLRDADVIISATASPHLIIKREDLVDIKKPILIIDLAVPRDVSPEVRNIEGIELFDLEDLNFLIEKNLEKRKREIPKAEEIVEKETEKLWEEITALEREEVRLP